MKSVSVAMKSHLAQAVTTLATCWKVTRTDGEVFAYTTHDQNITFEGVTYKSQSGFAATAITNDIGYSVDNLEVEGGFDDAEISEEALRAGAFDYADIRIFVVNWADLTMGAVKLRRGWYGEAQLTKQGIFRTELRGMHQALQQVIGELYSAECRADLGDPRCKVPLMPDDILRNTAYVVGDIKRIKQEFDTGTIGFGQGVADNPLALTNPGAESGTTGWTNTLDAMISATTPITAHGGTHYFTGGVGKNNIDSYQEVSVPAGAWQTLVDAGRAGVSFSWWQQALTVGNDPGGIRLEYLNGSHSVISHDESIFTVLNNVWQQQTIAKPLPTSTRFIRVHIKMSRNTANSGEIPLSLDAFFDDLGSVILQDLTPQANDLFSDSYHNRFFLCTTAGTTAATTPAYDFTVGNSTTDGSVVWEAQESWTRSGVVVAGTQTSANNHETFNVGITEVRAIDHWFQYGVLTWESGLNKGRSIEIRDWTQTNGIIDCVLANPYPVVLNDTFFIWPGCDKTLNMCKNRYANVINMRAEPYVPGQDVITQQAGANFGGG